MENCDVIIIGAGISGLSFAHYCSKKGLKTVVMEKTDRPGGSFHSHDFGGDAAGFWLELGAHTCYNSYRELLNVIEECGALSRLTPREKVSFKLYVEKELKSIPSQLDFIELFISIPRMFGTKKEGETMESYYSKIMGRRNYIKVLGPVFNAIISQRADDFPADALFKKRPRRKDALKNFTLTTGLQTITDCIAEDPGITMLTGKDVQAVEYRSGRFTVSAGDAGYESKYLAVATPPPAAARMLESSFPELSSRLAGIAVGNVETLGIALPKDAVPMGPLAGIIAVDDCFFSGVTRDTVKHEKYRGFAFHFKPGKLDFEGKLKKAADVLKVSPSDIKHTVLKNDNFVPSLKPGHGDWVKETDALLAGKPLALTGNYFAGVAIEDCVERSHNEFARLTRKA